MIKKWFRNMILIVLILCVGLVVTALIILKHPRFGNNPSAEYAKSFQQSANYKDGMFQYPLATPQLADDSNFVTVMWANFFKEKVNTIPDMPIPTVKTNLHELNRQDDVVIWLGHSSYYMQLAGKRILVDPVFSDYAAPFSYFNKIFAGTGIYSVEDMPEIDYLLISHDHWDHLDYPTVTELMPKVQTVISPLGIGSHLVYWGYSANKIQEADWFEAITVDDELTIHILPARHYSGRWLSKNKMLWSGFALVTPNQKIFLSGDSGYGPHFKEIATRLDGFDLVMLDSGQYDRRWPYVHMTPEEAVQAAEDLQAKRLMPAHVGKFSIAAHAWDEPFIRIVEATKDKPIELVTPLIGEPLWLDGRAQQFNHWWEGMH